MSNKRITTKHLKPLMVQSEDFIGNTCQAMLLLDRGVGAVAGIISDLAKTMHYSLSAVRSIPFFQEEAVEIQIAVGQLQSSFYEILLFTKRRFAKTMFADFSPLLGASGGSAFFSGVLQGRIAGAVANGVDWAVSLQAAAKQNDFEDVISFRTSGDESNVALGVLMNMTPVIVEDDIKQAAEECITLSKTMVDIGGMYSLFAKLKSLLQKISFDASKITASPVDIRKDELQELEKVSILTVKDETLQEIALRELGDAGRWHELAALNDIVIESSTAVYVPKTSFQIARLELNAGTSSFDYGGVVPVEYVQAGCMLEIRGANGPVQKMIVSSVEGSTVYLHGNFCTYFQGPIAFTRYDNRAKLGVFDYSTWNYKEFSTGDLKLYLQEVKDIYPRYCLTVKTEDKGQIFTVESVNYLENYVLVKEHSTGFPKGSEVQIFGTETSLVHLEPGTKIKLPVSSSSGTSLTVQSDAEIFGVDILLGAAGEFVIQNGDLKTAQGLDNLRQAIIHRVCCPYRSIIMHPEYGCGIEQILGKKNNAYHAALARATLVHALNNEPRADQLSQLTVRVAGDVLACSVTINTVGRNTTQDLNFVIGGGNNAAA